MVAPYWVRNAAADSRRTKVLEKLERGYMPRAYLQRALEAVQGALATNAPGNLAFGLTCEQAASELEEIIIRLDLAIMMFDENFE